MKKVNVLLLTLFSLVFSAHATDYYFSTTGSDQNSGTNSGSPYQTFTKLNTVISSLNPGDRVLFKRGDVFKGSFSCSRSGSSTQPITFGAYGTGAKPVISGFTTATGWTSLGNGIYESNALSTGSTLNVVVINGVQYGKGRYPNLDNGNGGYLTFENFSSTTITDNELPVDKTWSGAEVVIRTKRWELDAGSIDTIVGNVITFDNSTFKYSIGANNYGYFLQNDIKALDQFGEWYYNPATKKIDVYFGNNNPSSYTVQASSVDKIFQPQGSFLITRDIAFTGANSYAIYNDWDGVDNQNYINCSVTFSGIDGVCFASKTNLTIDSCLVDHSNSNGISVGYHDENVIISNCTITNTAMLNGMYKNDAVGRMGFGIFSLSQPATIGLTCINNIIKNTGYSAISFAGDNNLIQNNFIDSCCLYVDDGGGIYLVNNFTASGIPVVNQNNQVLYNIVDHSLGAGLGADKRYNYAHSYYSDDNSNHVRFIGNTGVNSGYSGIFTHNANNNIIQNNVFYNNYDNQMYYQDDGVGGYIFSNDVQGNNLFSLDGSKYMLYLASADNNFSTFFSVCNNNYYCSPFGESKLSYTNWFSHPTTFYDFTGWQNTYHQDLSTSKTPVSVTDVNNVFFQYNATNTPVKVILDGTYIELDHTPHNTGSIIIQPFSSVILIKISSTIPKKKKYNPFRGKFKN